MDEEQAGPMKEKTAEEDAAEDSPLRAEGKGSLDGAPEARGEASGDPEGEPAGDGAERSDAEAAVDLDAESDGGAPSPSAEADATEPSGPRQEPRLVVEALLFASPSSLEVARIAAAAELDAKQVETAIRELNEAYAREGRSFEIVGVAKGYQMMTRPEFHPYLQRLLKTKPKEKLTQASLETLAIIAYKQPIIRADVEAIRGVQSGQILRNLMERRLIRVAGRDSRLGHPLLYGTTQKFLEVFGLKSLKELPTLEELKAL